MLVDILVVVKVRVAELTKVDVHINRYKKQLFGTFPLRVFQSARSQFREGAKSL
jgi:hypothetical protein